MNKQLMDEMSFKKITLNQGLIIQDLDRSYNSMCSFMQLSSKYLPEAINNFKIGQQHIARIRQNLDSIHKIMSKIQKKINKEKQMQKVELQMQKHKENQQKALSDEIVTVGQAMNQMISEQKKDNFVVSSSSLVEMQVKQKITQTRIENELEKDQVDKLFAYYKLDDQEDDSQGSKQLQEMSPTTKKFQQAFTISPTKKIEQPFTIIKSPQKQKQQQQTTIVDEPLI